MLADEAEDARQQAEAAAEAAAAATPAAAATVVEGGRGRSRPTRIRKKVDSYNASETSTGG